MKAKRLFCVFILICVLLASASCGSADIVIRTKTVVTTAPSETSSDAGQHEQGVLFVNRNTGTFHISGDCSAVLSMKPENRLELKCDVQAALANGYKPCGLCSKIYKTEE